MPLDRPRHLPIEAYGKHTQDDNEGHDGNIECHLKTERNVPGLVGTGDEDGQNTADQRRNRIPMAVADDRRDVVDEDVSNKASPIAVISPMKTAVMPDV